MYPWPGSPRAAFNCPGSAEPHQPCPPPSSRLSKGARHPGGPALGDRRHPAHRPRRPAHLEAPHHHPRPPGVCPLRGGEGQGQVGHGEDQQVGCAGQESLNPAAPGLNGSRSQCSQHESSVAVCGARAWSLGTSLPHPSLKHGTVSQAGLGVALPAWTPLPLACCHPRGCAHVPDDFFSHL